MKRVLTAIVLLPIFIVVVLAKAPIYFTALVCVAAVLAAWEFEAVAVRSGAPPFRFFVCLLSLALLGSWLWPVQMAPERVLSAAFLVLLVWGLSTKTDLKVILASLSATLFGALYVGFLLGFMLGLHQVEGEGARLIFLLCISIWAGDSAAYYVGSTLGKHKLYPRVSPKKTWEGAVAGVAGSVLAAAIVKMTFYASLRWEDVVALGILLSVVGQLGDLFESLLKRGAGIKDSSNLLPGHGGVLDRLDSLLFNGPLLYYYHQVFMR
ncbi:MAG: phosphatidate cytidylyltransferase [Acidobacteriota bacterium]